MKNKLLITVLILFSVVSVIFISPKRIEKTFDGVFYDLGYEETQNAIQKVNISISGNYRRGLLFSHNFKGSINISNLYVNDDIHIVFDKNNKAYLSDTYYDDKLNRLVTETYGIIYIENGFKSISISIFNEESGGWDSEFGEIISAPASTRDEAIGISEKLLKYDLN
jgi:hypothetical protein